MKLDIAFPSKNAYLLARRFGRFGPGDRKGGLGLFSIS